MAEVNYTHPNVTVRRETHTALLTGVASTNFYQWLAFQKAKIRKISYLIVTAGTNDAAGIDFYNGTTSVGALTIGTNTAGAVLTSSDLATTLASGAAFSFKGKANSATMAGYYTIEWEVLQDATHT